jgi:cephalosporin hydroxylase
VLGERSNVFVYLDSDHHVQHVLAEMRAYSPLVPVGGYMVVADTNIERLRQWKDDNPAEAVRRFLRSSDGQFEYDRGCEKLVVTYNPGGFLRRVRGP